MRINKYKRLILRDRHQICKLLSLLFLARNEYEEICISIFNLDYPKDVYYKKEVIVQRDMIYTDVH